MERDNWEKVLGDSRYTTFEDPFSGMAVPKGEYNDQYGAACRAVFEGGIEVPLLFAENPLTCGEWRFTDDDSRNDLYDAAAEFGLVPSFSEVCAGETDAEKAARTRIEDSKRGEEVLSEIERLLAQLAGVETELGSEGLSGKRRKKLERRQRGLMSAIERSTDGSACGASE